MNNERENRKLPAPVIYPVSINNCVYPGDSAVVTGYHGAVLHGLGVFTTLKIEQGKPLWAAAHYQRLQQQAAKIGLQSTWSSIELAASLMGLLQATGLITGKARITLLARNSPWWPRTPWTTINPAVAAHPAIPINPANSAHIALPTNLDNQAGGQLASNDCDCLITVAPGAAASAGAGSLTVSPYRLHSQAPTAGIKTLNYVERLMIANEARARGYPAAIILNEQAHLVSSTLANVFWIADAKLYTPALGTGCLNGITRQVVLYLARQLAIDCQEVSAPITALDNAMGIFLTSAVLGLQPVTQWQQKALATKQLPLWQQLQQAYQTLLAQDPDAAQILPVTY